MVYCPHPLCGTQRVPWRQVSKLADAEQVTNLFPLRSLRSKRRRRTHSGKTLTRMRFRLRSAKRVDPLTVHPARLPGGLHDADRSPTCPGGAADPCEPERSCHREGAVRSEEHTSELQSLRHLV